MAQVIPFGQELAAIYSAEALELERAADVARVAFDHGSRSPAVLAALGLQDQVLHLRALAERIRSFVAE